MVIKKIKTYFEVVKAKKMIRNKHIFGSACSRNADHLKVGT